MVFQPRPSVLLMLVSKSKKALAVSSFYHRFARCVEDIAIEVGALMKGMLTRTSWSSMDTS